MVQARRADIFVAPHTATYLRPGGPTFSSHARSLDIYRYDAGPTGLGLFNREGFYKYVGPDGPADAAADLTPGIFGTSHRR